MTTGYTEYKTGERAYAEPIQGSPRCAAIWLIGFLCLTFYLGPLPWAGDPIARQKSYDRSLEGLAEQLIGKKVAKADAIMKAHPGYYEQTTGSESVEYSYRVPTGVFFLEWTGVPVRKVLARFDSQRIVKEVEVP